MKKLLLSLTFVAATYMAQGQVKGLGNLQGLTTSNVAIETSSTIARNIQLPKQYKDTLSCYYNEMAIGGETRWSRGKVILINGYLKAGDFSCTPNYAPMACAIFENVFIRADGYKPHQVIQLIITDIYPYKN